LNWCARMQDKRATGQKTDRKAKQAMRQKQTKQQASSRQGGRQKKG